MNIEEALYTLRQCVNCDREKNKKCLEIDCRECEHDYDADALNDSIVMICNLLIPKEPVTYDRIKFTVSCPNCGLLMHDKDRLKFCYECGQALDWSEWC